MDLHIFVHLEGGPIWVPLPRGFTETLQRIESKIETLLEETPEMATAMEDLKREVEETHGAVESMKTLLTGLADRLRGANSMREVRDIAADLDHLQGEIAEAVQANQVPEEEPPAPPAEPETPPDSQPGTTGPDGEANPTDEPPSGPDPSFR